MEHEFEMLRSERRSFFCPNKLWKELHIKTTGCTSISTYIKQAIIEKMIKEDPAGSEEYKSLLLHD